MDYRDKKYNKIENYSVGVINWDTQENELLNLIAELIVEIIIKESDKNNHENNLKLK